jgi:hypothetical protein
MVTEYNHRYKKKTEENPLKTFGEIKEIVRKDFPNLYARIGQDAFQAPKMIYRIPVIGGHNEISLYPVIYRGDGQPDRNIIYLELATESLLGDRINRKLRRTLDEMEFSEEMDLREKRQITKEEIDYREESDFHLGTAELIGEEILLMTREERFSRARIRDIHSNDLNIFLREYVLRRKASQKKELKMIYDPERKTLDIIRL